MDKSKRIEILDRYKMKTQKELLYIIPIYNDGGTAVAFLRPVTADYETSIPRCVELFSRWRRENPTLSPARFEITDERTKSWLDKLVINNDNRIIFMIQEPDGGYVGHIGFASFDDARDCADVDSVLKGEKAGRPRLMEYTMRALVNWGRRELQLRHIELDVMWDNTRAIEFYKRCGFQEGELVALDRVELADEVKWVPSEDVSRRDAEKYHLRMKLF